MENGRSATSLITRADNSSPARPRPRIRQILRHESLPTYLNSSAEDRDTNSKLRHQKRQLSGQSNDSGIDNDSTPYHHQPKQSLEAQYRQQFSCPGGTVFPQKASVTVTDGVAAYVLQPDGTMAAVRWDDKSALENNRPILTVLKREHEANMRGRSTGRIQSTSSSKPQLAPEMLSWLAGDDKTFSSNSRSSRASPGARTPDSTASPTSPGSRVGYRPRSAHSLERSPIHRTTPLSAHRTTPSPSIHRTTPSSSAHRTTPSSSDHSYPNSTVYRPAANTPRASNQSLVYNTADSSQRLVHNPTHSSQSLVHNTTHSSTNRPASMTPSSVARRSEFASSRCTDERSRLTRSSSQPRVSGRSRSCHSSSSRPVLSRTPRVERGASTTAAHDYHDSPSQKSNSPRILQSPSAGCAKKASASRDFTNQLVTLANANLTSADSNMHSSSSAQVQKISWSPESTPEPVQYYSNLPNGTRSMQHSSRQQRQLSLEKLPLQLSERDVSSQSPQTPEDKETPVWDYFKFFERCAVSDF